ncbi:glutamine--fructose-6-phosphate transaminase (isomerizing) [Pigmentibacter sp. JX0631]|uniref:glutamine--fructose-6-phosphate transaminase (isomerizing) n=1 Tax=Pigmentibacter sp. JX0631 TaxID=2976982 RepID=UPI00246910BE|nr:glutamine--fructose-6-phosphate transaminase (isomerizing) [Pigmentibacter sp. JX0631]WGL61421.1 glutamine--fructose-6-phosphate transaminase (isomerizing) [Pigmentibacter sp. JX0631]
MCGVIGYIGTGVTPEFFYNGLKRLEYRGYDSAGIAMLESNKIYIERAEGKLTNLQKKLSNLPKSASLGIGHTRWATHGKPTEQNAHPHRSDNIVLLHNGIIENYKELKEFLLTKNYVFKSETDTEVAAHLLNYELKKLNNSSSVEENMKKAISSLVKQIRGAFAFGIICTDDPETLYVVKYGSPIVLGIGENENYMASGITALVDHTREIIILEDNEIAYLKKDSIKIVSFSGDEIKRDPIIVNWSSNMLDKNGYDHFMLKEIHEQPQAVAQTINGRIDRNSGIVDLKAYGIDKINLKQIDRIQIIACGTSYYVSCLAKYYIEEFTQIPVEVDLASEYRYRTSTVNEHTLCIAVSQSGETIDTLQAIKFAKENKAKTLAIVNAPGSSIAHVCDDESLIYAGPEIGVASTKALSAQLSSLILLALGISQEKNKKNKTFIANCLEELSKVPSLIEKTLTLSKSIKEITLKYQHMDNLLFIGRGQQWPVALEGALKLKELSYIHAEGYAAGELKHGPIALIDENMSVVCLAPKDQYYEKTISNIEEIRARGGKILAIGTEGDTSLQAISDDFIPVTECSSIALPFLTTVPMHLFAYWIAVRRGNDVDQPRNLAKSVTVE